MNNSTNVRVLPAHGRALLLDAYWPEKAAADTPLVLFAHGFRGFKDWGYWHLAAKYFVDAGIAFVKFNLSHNGTTLENPLEFDDLDAFGRNNYSLELQDWAAVTEWAFAQPFWDQRNLIVIGHSRSGGLALIHAGEESSVTAAVTWASVSDMGFLFGPPIVAQMQEKGVAYMVNARTGQEMPLYKQFLDDYEAHRERFDLAQVLSTLVLPICLIHGTEDPAVPYGAAETLRGFTHGAAQVTLIEGADHVFGGAHPWLSDELPPHAETMLETSVRFVLANLT